MFTKILPVAFAIAVLAPLAREATASALYSVSYSFVATVEKNECVPGAAYDPEDIERCNDLFLHYKHLNAGEAYLGTLTIRGALTGSNIYESWSYYNPSGVAVTCVIGGRECFGLGTEFTAEHSYLTGVGYFQFLPVNEMSFASYENLFGTYLAIGDTEPSYQYFEAKLSDINISSPIPIPLPSTILLTLSSLGIWSMRAVRQGRQASVIDRHCHPHS